MSTPPHLRLFAHPSFDAHEQVVFVHDRNSGLRAILAIHDRTLGPALGGCRMWTYADEEAALDDVLRLSRAMTYKNALAGLDFGGGKAVILGNAGAPRTALLRAFGDAVERLRGAYVTAEDVGISDADMETVATRTSHVRGIGATGFGDPSPFTAWGVFCAMRAAIRYRLDRPSLNGLHVTLQGLGHVGHHLAALIHADGARMTVSDIDRDRVAEAERRFAAASADPGEIHTVPADIFAPCAMGGFLNTKTIPELGAGIVCGAANNQLLTPQDGGRLAGRGILYCPDYLVNAGGVISIAPERNDMTADDMKARIARIGTTLIRVLSQAEADSIPPHEVADRLASERIAAAGEARRASA
jgi:leucine dehydrogenase